MQPRSARCARRLWVGLSSPSVAKTLFDAAIELTGVANAQTPQVTLLAGNDGNATSDLTIPISFLLGDTNGNRAVYATDIAETKAESGSAASANNFRTDVTANGTINSSDIALVKSKSGTSLSSPSLDRRRPER